MAIGTVRGNDVARKSNRDANRRIEYGDFQTPRELADAICHLLGAERPSTVIEPTCGTGAFLAAAIDQFSGLRLALGMDVNPHYVAAARRSVARVESPAGQTRRVRVGDFFETDWPALLATCPEPWLILGNPPWVTNSALGVFGGRNLPPKRNPAGRTGIEGLTGKSNFDVSEWMIDRLLHAIAGRRATLAMLCKTAVARRVLTRVWQSRLAIGACEIRRIDAARHFDARIDACLLICRSGQTGSTTANDCRVFAELDGGQPGPSFGLRDDRLVADVAAYERVKGLLGGQSRWRSGIKHDCAAVFEFREQGPKLVNGLGETVELEPTYLYPLLKSSQVAAGDIATSKRWVLVPQERVGQETDSIARQAPRTWSYLLHHAEQLDRRASSVYLNQPRFSIFGVGPYTFSHWKVMVSGFYKSLRFAAVGPAADRPVVCDDTCYFLPCRNAREARALARLLNGPTARDFFQAFVFPDAKRPLTAEILNSLDLAALAAAL